METIGRINHVKGWKWNFYAGLVPLTAGFMTLLMTWISILNAKTNWGLPGSSLNFSFEQIAHLNEQLAAYVELSSSVGGVNIVIGAIAVMVISRYGLRDGHKWSWFYLLFSLVWVGFHDAWSATRFFLATGNPSLILPYLYCLLMSTGLIKTYRGIFQVQK